MDRKEPKGFRKSVRKAKEYLDDSNKTRSLISEAIEKSNKNKNKLSAVWDDLQALIRLSKAWIKGEYKMIPGKTMLFSVAAIIYFVSPLDVIPDFIFIGGFIDDATIIAFVINSISDDIKAFKAWENEIRKVSDNIC